MVIRLVVFVVLMLFWLFAGYVGRQPGAGEWAPLASSLIPWICVSLVGYEVYRGTPTRV